MSACVWCLVCDWWMRLSACHRDVSWHCAVLERKLRQVNEVWMVFWNVQNMLSRMYDLLMHCHWWLPVSRTWCTNTAVIGIKYHWRSWGWECVGIAYCALAIRSYCQNTSRSPFLLLVQMRSHQRQLNTSLVALRGVIVQTQGSEGSECQTQGRIPFISLTYILCFFCMHLWYFKVAFTFE